MGTIADSILSKKPRQILDQNQLDQVRQRNISPSQNSVDAVNNPALTAQAVVQNPAQVNIAPAQKSPVGSPQPIIGKAEVGNSDRPSIQEPKQLSYLEMFQRMYPAMSEGEIQKEKEREQRNQRMSAIGDAIGALANLVGTTKGAQNSFNPGTSLSAISKQYWDKLNTQRKADKDKYMALMAQAAQLDMNKFNSDAERELALAKYYEGIRQFNSNQELTREQDRRKQANTDRQYALDVASKEADIANNAEKNAISRKRLDVETKKYEKELKSNSVNFNLGDSRGEVNISKEKLGSNGIAQIFGTLPKDIQKQYMTPEVVENEYGIKSRSGRYLLPKESVMLAAIGMHAENSPETINILRAYAGAKDAGESAKGAEAAVKQEATAKPKSKTIGFTSPTKGMMWDPKSSKNLNLK